MQSNHPEKKDKYHFLFQSMWRLFFGAILIPVYFQFDTIFKTVRNHKDENWNNPSDELSFLVMKYLVGFAVIGFITTGIAHAIRFIKESNRK